VKREMRRQEREITEKEMILDILNRSQIVHLGLPRCGREKENSAHSYENTDWKRF